MLITHTNLHVHVFCVYNTPKGDNALSRASAAGRTDMVVALYEWVAK
jgi:hypothetical protein